MANNRIPLIPVMDAGSDEGKGEMPGAPNVGEPFPSIPASDEIEFELGQSITLPKGPAVIRYIGPLPGQIGTWIGLEVGPNEGKHDGMYEGKRYFTCAPHRGVFRELRMVREQVVKVPQAFPLEGFEEEKLLNEWSSCSCSGEKQHVRLYSRTLEVKHNTSWLCIFFSGEVLARVDLEHVTSFVIQRPPLSLLGIIINILSAVFGLYLRSQDTLDSMWEPWIPFITTMIVTCVVVCCRPSSITFGVKGELNPLIFTFGHGIHEIEPCVRQQQKLLREERARFRVINQI